MNGRQIFLACFLALILALTVFSEPLSKAFDSWRMRGCDYVKDIDAYALAVNPTNGDLWGTSHDRLFRFDGNDWQFYNVSSLQYDYVLDAFIVFDSQGRMWQGGHDGIGVFDGKNWIFYNERDWGLPDTVVTTIAFDPTGKPWIGLSADIVAPEGICGGISIFDNQRWMTYRFSDSSSIGPGCQNIQLIQFDSSGRAWLGLWNSTIMVLEKTQGEDFQAAIPGGPSFSLTTRSTGYFALPEESFPDEDEAGPVVIQNFYTNSKVYNVVTSDGRLVDEIRSIIFDKRGNIWVNSEAGLYQFKDSEFNLVRAPASSTVMDPQGNLWSIGQGISQYNGASWKTYRAGNSCIGNENIQSITFDNHGRAWVDLFPTIYENKFSLITFDQPPSRVPDVLLRLRAVFLPPINAWTRWVGPVILGSIWLLILCGGKWPALTFPLFNIILALASERTHTGQYYSIFVFELLTLFSLGAGLIDIISHRREEKRDFWKIARPGFYGTVVGLLLLFIAGILWRVFGPSS
jgi:hypothetical protein